MPITLDQAKKLEYGDVVLSDEIRNADGTPGRFKVTGAVKTWKRIMSACILRL